jgi:holin-like protein
MLDALTLLLLAQLIGEVLVRAAAAPVPGPVVGAAILAAFLGWRGIPSAMQETSQALLRHLPLLFVPAGVGVVSEIGVLRDYWFALGLALLVSTAATMVATVLVFDWATRRFGERPSP